METDDFLSVGIDYDKGLEIFMGNRELYHKEALINSKNITIKRSNAVKWSYK